MTTGLLLFATINSQPSEVDFTPLYKPNHTYLYELKADMEEVNTHLKIDFILNIHSTENGKSLGTVEVLSATNAGQDTGMAMPPTKTTFGKNGIPIDGENFEKAGLMVYVGLCTAYLPAETLKPKASYKIERKSDAFNLNGKGTFTKTTQDKLAVLESKTHANPTNFDPADLTTKLYFNPETKQVVRTKSTMTVGENSIELSLTLKSVKPTP